MVNKPSVEIVCLVSAFLTLFMVADLRSQILTWFRYGDDPPACHALGAFQKRYRC